MTPEQFHAMTGTPPPQGSFMQPQNGRMSPEQFHAMTGTTPPIQPVQVGDKTLTPKNQADANRFAELQDTYANMNKVGGGGTGFAQQFASKGYFAPETGNSEGTVGTNIIDVGKGIAKKVIQAGDFGITALNFLTGNSLSDDPTLQFGTASRKLKTRELFKGKNTAQKVGATIGDIGILLVTSGFGSTVEGAVGANRALQAAEFTGNGLTRTAARLAPSVAGNVAQGAAMTGIEGQDLTPGNIALDAGFAAAPALAMKGLKMMGLFGGMDSVVRAEVKRAADFARSNPDAWEAIVKRVDSGIENAGRQFSEINETKGALKEVDSFNHVIENNPEVFGANPTDTVGRHVIEINNNFTDNSLLKKGLLSVRPLIDGVEKYNQQIYDRTRELASKIDIPVDVQSIMDDASMRVAGRPNSEVLGAGKIIEDWLGKTPTTQQLLNIVFEPLDNLSGKAGSIQSAYAARQAAADYLFKTLDQIDPSLTPYFKELFKEAQLNAISKSWLNKIDKRVQGLGGGVGRRLMSEISGVLATGGSFSPFQYILGKQLGQSGYDAFQGTMIRKNIQRPVLFRLAKELGIQPSKSGDLANKINTAIRNMDSVGKQEAQKIIERYTSGLDKQTVRNKMARRLFDKKNANKIKGERRAKDIATKARQYIPEDKLPVIEFGGKRSKTSDLPVIR